MRWWSALASVPLIAVCCGCSATAGSSSAPACAAADLTLSVASVRWDEVTWWREQQVSVVSHRDCNLSEPAHLQTHSSQGWKTMATPPYTGPATPPTPLPTHVTPSGPTVIVDMGYTELHSGQLATCAPTDARVVVNGASTAIRLGCWQSGISLSGPGEGTILTTSPGQEMWLSPAPGASAS
jgi:hypothetical protein